MASHGVKLLAYKCHSDFQPRRSLLLRALLSQYAAYPPRAFVAARPSPTVQALAGQVLVRVPMHRLPRAVRLADSDNARYPFGQSVLPGEADGTWHLHRRINTRAV